MNVIKVTLKKLLGRGRAWLTPRGFTSELFDLIASPFADLKTRFISFKFIHFPTYLVDENNIKNGEELFGIKDTAGKTLEERAANIEGQWTALAGSQTYKQIEQILQQKGFPVRVIENIPQNYNTYGARAIGNGILHYKNNIKDPVVLTNGKHSFIVQSSDFFDEQTFKNIINTLVKIKPAQNVGLFIPRFLRKKEIHHVLTKSQMLQIQKYKYCDCRRGDA